jgi:hypothetical protein
MAQRLSLSDCWKNSALEVLVMFKKKTLARVIHPMQRLLQGMHKHALDKKITHGRIG